MPQFSRPILDRNISGAWVNEAGGTTNLYLSVDEIVLDNLDYLQTGNNPGNTDLYEGNLSNLDVPQTGDHIVRYTIGKNTGGGRTIDFIVRLFNSNDIEIGNWTHLNIDAQVTFVETLTAPELALINSYDGLYFRVNPTTTGGGAGRAGRLYWFEFETPNRQVLNIDETISLDTTITDDYQNTNIIESNVSLDMDTDSTFEIGLVLDFIFNLDSTITDDYSRNVDLNLSIDLLTDNTLETQPIFVYNPQINLDTTITDTYTNTLLIDSNVSLDITSLLESQLNLSFDKTFSLETTILDSFSVQKLVDEIINLDSDIQIDIESSKSGVFTIKVQSVNPLSMTTNKPLIIKWRK
jgi:hypothetical protein